MGNIDRIISLAQEQGISLAALCKKIGKSRTYLSEISSRHRAVPEEHIASLADALHTTPDYLLGKTDKKNKPLPTSGDELLYPLGYDKLTPANKAIVDRLIADLAKNQSEL